MTGTAAKRQPKQTAGSTDERLIQQCLQGNQDAWSALIDKYKNLIYSIPIKLGMHQDAADIFQAVCLDLLSELPRLREHRALPKWLMQTCYHKCLRWHRTASRHAELDPVQAENQQDSGSLPEHMLLQLEKEQLLREVIAEIPSRCGQMIHMLFFEIPPRPYEAIARQLRLAIGSIGFIRGRCLARVRKHLEMRGF
jgi:RNA polymerase sigma factor (sigma-70 family)